MSATDIRLRGRTRWSMAARCPRMSVYALRGEEPHEPSDRQRRIMARGRQLGEWMARRFALKYGPDNIVVEKPVLWPNHGHPVGELHTDVYVKPERMAVEVKSTAHSDSMIDDALTQLAGEVHFDPDADKGLLAFVDPSDLSEELLPFRLTDERREQVEEIARQVVDAGVTGELPARVCERPSDGRSRFCPFIDTCFADWTPPVTDVNDEDVRALAAAAYRRKEARDLARGHADMLEREYRETLATLGEHLEPGEYSIGPLKVRRTIVAGRRTFQIQRGLKTGMLDPALFEPFVRIGEPSERWTFERVSDEPLADDGLDDYGSDIPF